LGEKIGFRVITGMKETQLNVSDKGVPKEVRTNIGKG